MEGMAYGRRSLLQSLSAARLERFTSLAAWLYHYSS